MSLPSWLRLYLPLALAIGLGFYAWAAAQNRQVLAQIEAEQGLRLIAAQNLLQQSIVDAAADLRVLAGSEEIARLLAEDGAPQRAALAKLFATLAAEKPLYSKIRLLDAGGMETVRVQIDNGRVHNVEAAALQDKTGRDFLEKALELPDGQEYVSALDLNVEQGVIEEPYRPMLRYSMPLRDASGHARVVVINYEASALLQQLGSMLALDGAEGMLLDSAGYWLYHPDESRRWGAQLPPNRSFSRSFPAVWNAMQRNGQPQLNADGLFVFRRMLPLRDRKGLTGETATAGWWLLLRILPEGLEARQQATFGPAFWIVQLITALLALAILRARARAIASAAAEQAVLERTQREDRERGQVREQIYRLTLEIQSATSAERFAEAVLSRLAPQLGVVVGAFHQLQGDRLRLLAGYGLTSDFEARELRLDQGLVGEAVRNHSQVLIEGLPDRYFHTRSGSGSSAPSRLLVIPLWVRERNLGALELGLSAPLNPVQQQFLKQLVPLLALNLDGFLLRQFR